MGQRLRVAVVGGGIGAQHIAAYRKLPELYEVRALCDIDPSRAASVAGRFAIPLTLTSFEELLSHDDLDLIDICTPSNLHFKQTQAAATWIQGPR